MDNKCDRHVATINFFCAWINYHGFNMIKIYENSAKLNCQYVKSALHAIGTAISEWTGKLLIYTKYKINVLFIHM